MVVNEKTGLIVEKENVNALAEALVHLINNERKRVLFGYAGRKHVQQNYNWDSNVSKMEQIYFETVNYNECR